MIQQATEWVVCSTATAPISQTFLEKIEPFKDNITVFLIAVLVVGAVAYITYICNETSRFESCDRVRIAQIESEFEDEDDE